MAGSVRAPSWGLWLSVVVCVPLLWFAWRWTEEHEQRRAAMAQASRDSLTAYHAARHAADSARLVAWADRVVTLRGDSLAVVLAERALAARRWRYLPGRVDTPIQSDTLRDTVCVAGADLRAVLVVDSAQRVRADSLQGELDQARYDLGECQERPQRGAWAAFGAGVAVGMAGAAAACLVGR